MDLAGRPSLERSASGLTAPLLPSHHAPNVFPAPAGPGTYVPPPSEPAAASTTVHASLAAEPVTADAAVLLGIGPDGAAAGVDSGSKPVSASGRAPQDPRVTAVIYGIINAVVGLPCMIGFAAVIFS
ncbi:hypothetical protein MNEG_11342, partial [Monoraphidium neglectum]